MTALLVPASAQAVTAIVKIDPSGYVPQQIVVKPGTTVDWQGDSSCDPVLNPCNHGVVLNQGDTPVCSGPATANTSCGTHDFPSAGRFGYYDPMTCAPPGGDSSTCSVNGLVIVDGPPTATALSGPGTAPRNQQVTFSGSGSDPNGDSITSYNWDFGDGTHGSTSTGQVQHTYATANHYTVSLTVTDSRGNVSSARTVGMDVTVPDSDGDGVNDDNDACPAEAAPGQANGCPPVVPPPIIIPPEITTGAISANALAIPGAIKSGINVIISCSDTCTAALTLMPASSAKRAALLPNVPLATATASLPTGGTTLVTLKLSAAAKKALAKAKTSKLRLEVAVTDGIGRVKTMASSLSLKPLKNASRLPAIGISDEQAATFSDPLFQVMKLKYARYVTPWNSITKEPARLDEWLQAARAQGVRPLIAFEHTRGQLCPGRKCKGPSVSQYKRAWRAFHKKYPWVKDISPWNEANSATQPTGKHPELAAAYYNVVRASCRGCSIVAADVLDLNNMRRYLAKFLAKAKGKPRLWGIHNYRDTNRFRQTGTKQLLAAVKGQVWFTETGGIVKFTTQGGRKALPKSESRAKRAMDYMFKLAALDSKRVKRVYVYQWKVNFAGDRFDAGVVRPDGKPRPSYDVLTLNASIARKR